MRFVSIFIVCIALSLGAFGQKKDDGKPLAPEFSVASIDGAAFDSAKLKGKIIVLNLWFINCPNCVEEIKSLNAVVDQYQNEDVVFIGMATNKKTDLEKFLKKNPFKYNIVPMATQTILSFGEPDKNGAINVPFPMHIVINRTGEIVVRTSGTKGVKAIEKELAKQFETKDAAAK